jgi:hypothetical protein
VVAKNEISCDNLNVPPPAIQREEGNKTDKSFYFWLAILIIVSVALAGGIIHRLLPKPKDKATVSPKDIATSPKNTVVCPNNIAVNAILYSEDKPSALIGNTIAIEGDIIDDIKVVKINKDTVELEKDGQRWTQRKK